MSKFKIDRWVDITKMSGIDCVVNAADCLLSDRGKISSAIFKKAGPQLYKACEKIGHCNVGDAVATPPFNYTNIKCIIHAVGPHYTDGHHGEKELLYSCYYKALELMKNKGYSSIVFPLISTGAHGFPVEDAISVAFSAFDDFIKNNDDNIEICLVTPDKQIFSLAEQMIQPYIHTTFSPLEVSMLEKIDREKLQECINYFISNRSGTWSPLEKIDNSECGNTAYHLPYPTYDFNAFSLIQFSMPTYSDMDIVDTVLSKFDNGLCAISDLKIHELLALLDSYSVRERFCVGVLAEDIQNCNILKIFLRIEDILKMYDAQKGKWIRDSMTKLGMA